MEIYPIIVELDKNSNSIIKNDLISFNKKIYEIKVFNE